MIRSALLLLAAAVLLAGCGGSGADPAKFAVQVDGDLTHGRFERAWRTLHPAQQRFLNAAALTDCWTRSRMSALEPQLRFEAEGVRDEPWQIAGGPAEPQASKAVRVRIRAAGSREVLDTFTQHVFQVDGDYRWIVTPALVRQFRAGACGSI